MNGFCFTADIKKKEKETEGGGRGWGRGRKEANIRNVFFSLFGGNQCRPISKKKMDEKNSSPLAVHFFYARAQRSDTQTNIQNEGRKRERESGRFPVISSYLSFVIE